MLSESCSDYSLDQLLCVHIISDINIHAISHNLPLGTLNSLSSAINAHD